MDSRFRGNDVTFERAAGLRLPKGFGPQAGDDPSPEGGFGPQGEKSRIALKTLRARFLAALGMTARKGFPQPV